MLEHLPEAAEPAAVLAFTLAGATAELTAATSLAGGETVVGLWFAYVGAVALYAGTVAAGDLPARLGTDG
jgi:trimethylamine:corrinoid methyltransferase-like protein